MTIVAVLLGGLVGTGLRLGLDALLPHADDAFPWSTLLINVVGSFALGALVARVWPIAPHWLKAGLGAGLLGSFTTFSALAVSLVTLADAGEWRAAARATCVVSVVAGLGAAVARAVRLGRAPGTDRARGVSALVVVIGARAPEPSGRCCATPSRSAFARTPSRLPWAVLIVNVVGSLVGGVVLGLAQAGVIGADLRLILLSGFAGGLTTFSTFSVETIQLIDDGPVAVGRR